ncbi:hypothetical protein Tco_1575281 [Tanacetum coccineum]
MAVLRFVMEHQLKAYPLAKPVVHKKQPINPDMRKVFKEKVFEWLKAGVVRRVQYPGWVTNAMPIKQRDGTWKVYMDFEPEQILCKRHVSFPRSRGKIRIACRASKQMLPADI